MYVYVTLVNQLYRAKIYRKNNASHLELVDVEINPRVGPGFGREARPFVAELDKGIHRDDLIICLFHALMIKPAPACDDHAAVVRDDMTPEATVGCAVCEVGDVLF